MWSIYSGRMWSICPAFSGDDIGKSMATTSGWEISGTLGDVGNDQASNNSSGFSALPNGFRNFDGAFSGIGLGSNWWTSTEASATNCYHRGMYYGFSGVGGSDYDKRDGFAIRCIKD